MIQTHLLGKVSINDNGQLLVICDCPNMETLIKKQVNTAEIILNDGRCISPEQRRKCYALIGEIAEYVEGVKSESTIESTKELMKMEFMLHRMEGMERRLFSLSNVDVTTASAFIDFLICFIIENDIPTKFPLVEQAEDVKKYIYVCLLNKKCAVCGRTADLHHVDRIGMGGNRDKVEHIGRQCLPLCREHHTELHGMAEGEFLARYHLDLVKIDARIAKVYGLNK